MPKTNTKKSVKKTAKKTVAAEEMSLHDLLITKLQALYDTEQQLVKALPKMAKASTDEDLKNGFEQHKKQTEQHVERLERAFEVLEEKPKKLECDGIRGIVADGEWVIKNTQGDAALDAALAAAAQYAEHYEMAGYATAISWAKQLNQQDIVDLLQETFDEEKETSDTLTELSQSKLDERASGDTSGDASGDTGESDDE